MATTLRELFTPFFSYVLLFVRTPSYRDQPFAEVRRGIDDLIEKQRTMVKQHDVPEADYKTACFAAVAWADELMLSSTHTTNRELYEQWKRRPLQVQLFNTANAGEEFFDYLARLSPSQKEIAEIYHLCLALGFRGRYYDDAQTYKIIELRRELAQRGPVPFPELLEIEKRKERVTPQPYDAKALPASPPRLPSIGWAWLAVPIVALLLLYALWPAPPPPPEVPAGRTREEIMADVESRVKPFQCCSIAVSDFQDGTVALGGRVESEEQRAQVRQAAAEVHEVSTVQDTFTIVPRPFCQVIELLTPFQSGASAAATELSIRPRKGCDAVYYANETLVLDVASAKPLDYIYVDYYVADRQAVAHIVPSTEQRTNYFRDATSLAVGEPGSKAQWQIRPPFGMEMVTVITSPEPLFAPPRLAPEGAGPYIQELQKVLPADAGSSPISASFCFIRSEAR